MRAVLRRARTFARAFFRIVLQCIRVALIVSLAFMPLPVTALLAMVLTEDRREIAALVVRKE